MPMLATRGCPYECTFCSNPEMWTTRWIARNPTKVLDEMQLYQERYGATNFDFYDLTAIVKRSWIIEFTQMILDRKMQFTWQLPSGTRSEAIDGEVSRLLYESGCRNMSYAPESGSPEVLKRIKKVVKLDRLEKSVRGAVNSKLNVKLNIIMGFPNESTQRAAPDDQLSVSDGTRRGARHEHLDLFAVPGLRAVSRPAEVRKDSGALG